MYEDLTYNEALVAIKNTNVKLGELPDKLRANYTIVFAAVTVSGQNLAFASKELKDDEKIVYRAVSVDGLAYKYASDRLKENTGIIEEALKNGGNVLYHIPDMYRTDKKWVMTAVSSPKNKWYNKLFECNGKINLPLGAVPEFSTDYEIVQAAVAVNPLSLKFAAENLQADESIVLGAILAATQGETKELVKYLSPELLSNKSIQLLLVSKSCYKYTDALDAPIIDQVASIKEPAYLERLSNSPNLSKKTVKQYLSLQFSVDELYKANGFDSLPPELKNDRDIALLAVKQAGYNLQYLSDKLKDDYEVVKTAVDCHGVSLQDASERLQKDEDLVEVAMNSKHYPLRLLHLKAGVSFSDNKARMIEAVSSTARNLEFASDRLKADREIVLTAVSAERPYNKESAVLQFVDDSLKDDFSVVYLAVRNNSWNYLHASDRLKAEEELIRVASTNSCLQLKSTPEYNAISIGPDVNIKSLSNSYYFSADNSVTF